MSKSSSKAPVENAAVEKKVKETAKAVEAVDTKKEAAKEEPVKEVAVKEEEPKRRTRKSAAETTAETVEKKEPAKRGRKVAEKAEEVKSAASKAVKAVATPVKANVVLQFPFGEYSMDDIVEMCKKAYTRENKTKIKNIDVYVKPADKKAYYVVNDKVAGSVDL